MVGINRIQQVYNHAQYKYICGTGNLMKVLRGERGINGQILKVLFYKRLWWAQILRTYMTLRNHYTKTLSASPKYEAMECLIFPGNRFSYNTESVPNEIIFIVIQFGGKWIEYFYESFIATAVFFAIFLIVSLHGGQDLRKARNF